jgi:hypothetical protein
MAHFYGSMKGQRGERTACGTKSSGMSAHVRGWEHGVRIVASHYDTQVGKPDTFAVYMTTGSNATGPDVYLGEVYLDKKGEVKFKRATKSPQKGENQ